MTTTSVRSDPAPAVPLAPGMSPSEIFAAYDLTCPPRVGTLRDPSRATYGRAVARISAKLGQPLMPWQRYTADVALEVDPATGGLAYRNVWLLVPRQSGKTTVILGVKVHRALKMGAEAARHNPVQGARQRILYAAQKRIDAREKFCDDQLPILQTSPFAGRFRTRMLTGHESLIWDTGAYDGITSNQETSGHGKTLDLGFEDEAFAAVDGRLEQAYSPAMVTRWSPQHWVVSTEGTEKSVYLAAKVDLGRELVTRGEPTATCYLEWSQHDGPRDDPATWLGCMPALCPTPGPCVCAPGGTWRHTVGVGTIRAELEKLPADEFDRAYLNRRKRYAPPPDPNVPTTQWGNCADTGSRRAGDVALAVDVTPAGNHTSIGLAGPRADGRMHLELAAFAEDTDWVAAWLAERLERLRPVAIGIDAKGPAGALLTKLAERGICTPREPREPVRGELWIPTANEVAAACGSLAAAIRQDEVRHSDQEQLNTAMLGARTRPLTDAWAWARRQASVNISPLVAVTLARAAYEIRAPLVAEDYNPLDNIW